MLALALALLAAAPSDQTIIFYNGRMALRERRPSEALKLWLLHNTVANNRELPGDHDPDFRSVVWAALGELGYCPDGLQKDTGGAGLWPIAVHNWVVRNMNAIPSSRPPPFDAYDVGRDQRFIAINDVLSHEELRSVSFFRSGCLIGNRMLVAAGFPAWDDLSDRRRTATLMRYLLQLSRNTFLEKKLQSRAVLEARIFDLDLVIADLAAREARRFASDKARQARELGVSAAAAKEMKQTAEPFTFAPDSEEAMILRESLTWTPEEWLTLTEERRLFLFTQARKLSGDHAALDSAILAMVDALIAEKKGPELEQWLAYFDASDTPARRAAVFMGERGQNLLNLDKTSGFKERAVIALHRGTALLESGDLQESLRSFAFALQHADESRAADAVTGLSRRWLSYVLGRHETNEEIVATLWALVPRQQYNAVVEDLVWRAALRADAKSFTIATKNTRGNTAFDDRIERLRPLAQGKLGNFTTQLRDELTEEPNVTMRFLRQFIERLEAEDGDVRQAHAATIEALMKLLAPLLERKDGGAAQRRRGEELLARCQALADGIAHLPAPPGSERNIHTLSPSAETFAGSIRLAPADPLPWPFKSGDVSSPSVFLPLLLTPVEWREGDELVFGWKVSE